MSRELGLASATEDILRLCGHRFHNYLSRNGRIRLIFIRYDEGERSVVPENIVEELSEKSAAPKP